MAHPDEIEHSRERSPLVENGASGAHR
jgi:hypothetical protein